MDPEDCTLDGVLVVTDEAEMMEDGCEGGDHNLGSAYLTTVDSSECIIHSCLACTADEMKQGIIVSMTPRENREPVT